MDLLTPAAKWASAEPSPTPRDHHPVDRMPFAQRMAMLATVVVPLLGLATAIVLLWQYDGWLGIGVPELLAMIVMYALCGFGITIGYHRLLTHRAFETYRPVRLLLAALGSAAGQGMTIRWCATHRRHHQVADRIGDPHSPHLHGEGFRNMIRGMWYAHLGWVFEADKPDLHRSVGDLVADKGLLLIDRLYFLWVLLGIALPGMALGLFYGSWQGFFAGALWGGLVRIALMQHVTWAINSVCHVWGTTPFNSADHSTNNLPLAILALGEGWHNNHHAFPTSAKQGLQWYQFDLSWVVIRVATVLGLVWAVRVPSESAMNAKRR